MKKSFIHRANRNRKYASDTDRLNAVQSYIPRKYSPLQYQTLRLPKGRFGQRRPDILIKMYSSTIPVEHDGGIHGFNDDISETKKTQDRNDDYIRDGYLPIIINQLQLEEEGITEELFVRCAMILFEPIYRSKQRLQLTK